jgi:UDP-GlcNAc:undecaprenyl-phosphate GlcNAc-1-phosphate transferase
LIQHLIVGAVAAGVTALATPGVVRIARRFGAVDVPEDRKVHKLPTPTSGGIAIYAGVLAGVLVARFLPAFRELFVSSTEPFGVMVAATLVCCLGVVDDVRGMKAPTKLAGQVLASGALVLGGVSLFYFWMPGVGVLGLSQDLSALITVIWAVALINALNLVDGLDGLAAGVTTIAAGTLFVYAYRTGGGEGTAATLIPALIVGSCLGFLPHNFNPAKIFMGDSGSMLLGILLASSTVSGVGRTVEPTASDAVGLIVPVLLPFFVLAVPLADASFAIMRRMRARTPVFHPDKSHIHHWLLEMARSHRQAVIVMYSWSAMLAAAALVLSLGVGPGFRYAAVGIGVVLVASILVVPRMLRRGAVWMAEMREMDAAPTVPHEVAE